MINQLDFVGSTVIPSQLWSVPIGLRTWPLWSMASFTLTSAHVNITVSYHHIINSCCVTKLSQLQSTGDNVVAWLINYSTNHSSRRRVKKIF